MLKNNKTLSCIIITYNQSKYILEAIASVLCQDYPSIELIVADDYSQDFDRERLVNYIEAQKNDNLIAYTVYQNHENLGTVRNINTAIKKATGNYIKIFGGDDVIANAQVFSSQVNYLESQNDKYIVTGKSIQCDQNMNEIFDVNVENNNRLILSVINAKAKKEKHRIISKNYIFPFMTQSMCFRIEFFEKYGLYDEKYQLLEDTPMMNRIIDLNIPIGFEDNFAIKHRTKVGISAVETIYNPRSIRYYEDVKAMALEKFEKSENFVEKIKQWHAVRIASLRIDLCNSKTKRQEVATYLKYVPNIVIYLVSNPSKSIKKIFHKKL